MPRSKSLELFTSRPLSSMVLAVLCVLIGLLVVSGLVPGSANRNYFPGHEWVLATGCWALALFFSYCAVTGRNRR